MEWVITLFAQLICVVIFGGVGIYSFVSKMPVGFWSGEEVKKDEVTDVRAYNRANGIMWTFFTLPQIVSVFFTPFSTEISSIIMISGILIGVPCIIIVYTKIIKKKYRVKLQPTASTTSKPNRNLK